jgi:hypothetical protein
MQEPTEGIMEDHEEVAANAYDEAGLTTAELLGNAALGVLALVAIWALVQQLGVDIVEWIRGQLIG